MLGEGVRLQQFQLVAIEFFSCDAQLAIFSKPHGVMGADLRHDRLADAKGPQLAIQAWPDRFGCKFDYDQMFHRCPTVYRSRDCVFQFSDAMQQISQRPIMKLVSSQEDRETN